MATMNRFPNVKTEKYQSSNMQKRLSCQFHSKKQFKQDFTRKTSKILFQYNIILVIRR